MIQLRKVNLNPARSSVKPLIIVIGETISLEVQKLLSSMTENKVWRRPYVNFGGLFSQILGSLFSEITYFMPSLMIFSLFTK